MRLAFLLFLVSLQVFGQKIDTRTFQQISDSIMAEADELYLYEMGMIRAIDSIDKNRDLRKKAGEIIRYKQGDSLVVIAENIEKKGVVAAQFKLRHADDYLSFNDTPRAMTDFEKGLMAMKHVVIKDVQSNYEITPLEDGEYQNIIFIPFKEKIQGNERELYKLYVLTENKNRSYIPFGKDYLFYADEGGKVFYHLSFNPYMPVGVSNEIIEKKKVEISYPKREPYLLPTDMMLFRKYGLPFQLNTLRVKSTQYDIYFNYDAERNTIDVTLD